MPELAAAPNYHALLIGIDDYAEVEPPLHGSVNDVDAVAALLQQVCPRPMVMRKLVAPHRAHRLLSSDEALPTRANIVQALKDLAAAVRPGDRALFYYSGHGASAPVPATGIQHEALVPQDFGGTADLLWDLELSGLLDSVFAVSGDLNVVLDACYAAGVTRGLAPRTELTARQIQISSSQRAHLRNPDDTLMSTNRHSADRVDPHPGYSVLAAAHSFQTASEMPFPEGQFGLLTHALLQVLRERQHPNPQALLTLRWADLWPRLCALVWERAPNQQPSLLGPRENRVFGGLPGSRALGLALRQQSPGIYEVDAGEQLGVGVGARLAVYSELPAEFPPLDSPADRALPRLGELRVIAATDWSAVATSDGGPLPAKLPSAACARLIAAAPTSRLKVSLAAAVQSALGPWLFPNQLADGIRYLALAEAAEAEAHLGQDPDGGLWLGDRVYGAEPAVAFGAADTMAGPLLRIARADSSQNLASQARAALRHYASYVRPLRLVQRHNYSLDAQLLNILVIPCLDKPQLRALLANPQSAQPLQPDATGRILLHPDQRVAFGIHNGSMLDLHFLLLCCKANGTVEILGASHSADIAARSRTILGRFDPNEPGSGLAPFSLQLDAGSQLPFCVERLVAFMTNDKSVIEQLGKLAVHKTFADSLSLSLGGPTRGLHQGLKDDSQLLCTAKYLELQIG